MEKIIIKLFFNSKSRYFIFLLLLLSFLMSIFLILNDNFNHKTNYIFNVVIKTISNNIKYIINEDKMVIDEKNHQVYKAINISNRWSSIHVQRSSNNNCQNYYYVLSESELNTKYQTEDVRTSNYDEIKSIYFSSKKWDYKNFIYYIKKIFSSIRDVVWIGGYEGKSLISYSLENYKDYPIKKIIVKIEKKYGISKVNISVDDSRNKEVVIEANKVFTNEIDNISEYDTYIFDGNESLKFKLKALNIFFDSKLDLNVFKPDIYLEFIQYKKNDSFRNDPFIGHAVSQTYKMYDYSVDVLNISDHFFDNNKKITQLRIEPIDKICKIYSVKLVEYKDSTLPKFLELLDKPFSNNNFSEKYYNYKYVNYFNVDKLFIPKSKFFEININPNTSNELFISSDLSDSNIRFKILNNTITRYGYFNSFIKIEGLNKLSIEFNSYDDLNKISFIAIGKKTNTDLYNSLLINFPYTYSKFYYSKFEDIRIDSSQNISRIGLTTDSIPDGKEFKVIYKDKNNIFERSYFYHNKINISNIDSVSSSYIIQSILLNGKNIENFELSFLSLTNLRYILEHNPLLIIGDKKYYLNLSKKFNNLIPDYFTLDINSEFTNTNSIYIPEDFLRYFQIFNSYTSK